MGGSGSERQPGVASSRRKDQREFFIWTTHQRRYVMHPRIFLSLTAVGIAAPMFIACNSDDNSTLVAPMNDAGQAPEASSSSTSAPDATSSAASNPDAASSAAASPDASSSASSSDASSDAASSDAGSAATDAAAAALVRVAHLSPDAPAVDFCIAAHGTTSFSGPVLKGASLTAGLSYPSVTQYLPVPAGQYDVRLVAPNAADCHTSLAGLADFEIVARAPGRRFGDDRRGGGCCRGRRRAVWPHRVCR